VVLLRQRLATLERGTPPAWPNQPLPAPPPDAKQRKDAAALRRRREAAAAEQARIVAERTLALEAARVAEVERQRLWQAHEPERTRALSALDALAALVAAAEDNVAELYAQRSALRKIAQKYGRPAG